MLRRVFCTCPFAYMRFHYTRRYEELASLDPYAVARCINIHSPRVRIRISKDDRFPYTHITAALFWNYRENK